MRVSHHPLYLDQPSFRFLFEGLGPSLGLWRAAEIAALREQRDCFRPPILDLGCGDGYFTALVLHQIEIGLDPDPAVIAGARARATPFGPLYARLITAPMESADLPPASLGSILSNSVLEHIPTVEAALAAAASALVPGGCLIFTVPTEDFSRRLALPLASYAARRNRHFQHLNLWSTESWVDVLSTVGFEVESVRPYLRPGLVWMWDVLELFQMIRLGSRRLFGLAWRRLPPGLIDRLAERAAHLDLSAPAPGGGRLIVARKR